MSKNSKIPKQCNNFVFWKSKTVLKFLIFLQETDKKGGGTSDYVYVSVNWFRECSGSFEDVLREYTRVFINIINLLVLSTIQKKGEANIPTQSASIWQLMSQKCFENDINE